MKVRTFWFSFSANTLLTLQNGLRKTIFGALSDWSAGPSGPQVPAAPLASAQIPDYQSVTGAEPCLPCIVHI